MNRIRFQVLIATVAAACTLPTLLGAQPVPQYELTIRNPVLAGSTYRFDLYVRRVGTTAFRIGNSQFIMTFNTGTFASPALSRVAASEQIGTGFFFDQVISGGELRISLGGNHSYASAADIATAGDGTRISTFEITGVSVPVVSASLEWVNLPALVRTGVSEIDAANDYRDITDATGASHIGGGGEFAAVSGYAFEDLDGDGAWEQPAEPPLDGWTISVNGPNGMLSGVTGSGSWTAGYYEFVNLTPGSWALTQQLQAGWSPTLAPVSPMLLASGVDSTGNNFGNFHGPTARGTAFRDLDGDGTRDPGEPPLAGWSVHADKTGGGGNKTQLTSVLGEFVFTFTPAESGFWDVSAPVPAGWIATVPAAPGAYAVDIQSGAYATGLDFGLLLPSRISGTKFEDLNGDSVLSPGEPGLAGWIITLFRNSTHYDSAITDAAGGFEFDSLPSGSYEVSEELPAGWTQLLPGSPSTYSFLVDTGGDDFTGRDFGNFRYGSVSGEVYFDLNHNGSRDPGEAGMTGIEIVLAGPKTSRSLWTAPGGAWSADDVLADNLIVTEIIPPGYLLTQPPGGSYAVAVTSGSIYAGLQFGNSSSTDSTMFRTMSYDSLVESRDRRGKLLKAEKRKPDKVEFSMNIRNNTGQEVDGLQVRLRIPVYFGDSLYPFVVTPTPASVSYSPGSQYAMIEWTTPIAPDSSVDIHAWGLKAKRYPDTYHHWYAGGLVVNRSTPIRSTSTFLAYRLPLPNRINAVEDIFRSGAFPTGILVGVERTDMAAFFAWARIRTLNNFRRSIVDRFVVHSTVPRNFYLFDNTKRMRGEQKKLSPRKHNNRLFADALTLKTSIAASQLTIFPPGLGELIYEDGANPLSGRTLLQIAAAADSLLTNWTEHAAAEYYNMDSTLRKINASFEGPIDTFSFATDLRLTGTRQLRDVPFLRANPGTVPVIVRPDRMPAGDLPEAFTLHQNYPNPFNPVTTIGFDLPGPAVVTLTVYNVLGEEIGTVLNGELLDEGLQEVDFEAGSLPTGIYFYRIVATAIDDETLEEGPAITRTKKMMLVK